MEQPELVYNRPLAGLRTFNISDVSPGQYRFVDCAAYLETGSLVIHAFRTLPLKQYCAISYVWRGLAPLETPSNEIEVQLQDGQLLVSPDVLRIACTFCTLKDIKYLWVDCLCINQTDQKDKDWQIWKMAEIFKNCSSCIILPVGLRRLLRFRIGEDSTWMSRRWTLQEAVLPETSIFLFEWKLGPGRINDGLEVHSIPGTNTAYCDLAATVKDHETQFFRSGKEVFFSCSGTTTLLSHTARSCVDAMLGSYNENRGIRSYNASYMVAFARKADSEAGSAVWISMHLRESSNSIDRIYSCMSLLGVSLDPTAFRGASDPCYMAMIRMAKQHMEQGGRAHWLSLLGSLKSADAWEERFSHHESHDWLRFLSPMKDRWCLDRRSCTFVRFEEDIEQSSESERQLGTIGGTSIFGYLKSPPTGTMDDSGYLTIRVRATPLPRLSGSEKDRWLLDLGEYFSRPWISKGNKSIEFLNETRQYLRLVVIEHAPKKWHIWNVLVMHKYEDRLGLKWPGGFLWQDLEFSIGGSEPFHPEPLQPEPLHPEPLHPDGLNGQRLPKKSKRKQWREYFGIRRIWKTNRSDG